MLKALSAQASAISGCGLSPSGLSTAGRRLARMPPPNLSQLPGPWPPPSSGSCRILVFLPTIGLHAWPRLGVARTASNAIRLIGTVSLSITALGFHKSAVGKRITFAAAGLAACVGRVTRAGVSILPAIDLVRHWSYLAFLLVRVGWLPAL